VALNRFIFRISLLYRMSTEVLWGESARRRAREVLFVSIDHHLESIDSFFVYSVVREATENR